MPKADKEGAKKSVEKNRFASDLEFNDAPFDDKLRDLPNGLLGSLRTHKYVRNSALVFIFRVTLTHNFFICFF
jgi:hypothetical protein